MKKFYKFENDQIFYHETWFNRSRNMITIHSGKVGEMGETQDYGSSTPINDNTDHEIAKFFHDFELQCHDDGYFALTSDQTHMVVIQFPLTTKDGEKQDLWFKDRVCERLNEHLGWRGLGNVDGFDIGMYQMNVFCFVCNATLAIQHIQQCLKESALNIRPFTIATRKLTEQNLVQKFSTEPTIIFQPL